MKVKITPSKPVPPVREFILNEEEAEHVRHVLGNFNLPDLQKHLGIEEYAKAKKADAFSYRLFLALEKGLKGEQ